MSPVGALRMFKGTGSSSCLSASCFASRYATSMALDLGAMDIYTTASVKCTLHSGMPMKWQAW